MNINEEIINRLKDLAKQAFDNREIPVSAVIVDSLGNIISEGLNTRQSTGNVLGHAEINAILAAGDKLEDWRLDGYSIIVTLEPCEMCSCIIKESRLDKVYYFLQKKCVSIDDDKYLNDWWNSLLEIDTFNVFSEHILQPQKALSRERRAYR